MAVVYMDWYNGDDATGDGTPSAPYQNFGTATTGLSPGDEVRVAKTPHAWQPITQGALQWTQGSTNVYTDGWDPTGVIDKGDILNPDPAGNPKHGYLVTAVFTTYVRLERAYFGPTQTVTTSRLTGPTRDVYGAADSLWYVNADGIKISGGWDLTTETQDGETWLWQQRPGYEWYHYEYGLYPRYRKDLDVSNLVFVNLQYGLYEYQPYGDSRYTNLWGIACYIFVYGYPVANLDSANPSATRAIEFDGVHGCACSDVLYLSSPRARRPYRLGRITAIDSVYGIRLNAFTGSYNDTLGAVEPAGPWTTRGCTGGALYLNGDDAEWNIGHWTDDWSAYPIYISGNASDIDLAGSTIQNAGTNVLRLFGNANRIANLHVPAGTRGIADFLYIEGMENDVVDPRFDHDVGSCRLYNLNVAECARNRIVGLRQATFDPATQDAPPRYVSGGRVHTRETPALTICGAYTPADGYATFVPVVIAQMGAEVLVRHAGIKDSGEASWRLEGLANTPGTPRVFALPLYIAPGTEATVRFKLYVYAGFTSQNTVQAALWHAGRNVTGWQDLTPALVEDDWSAHQLGWPAGGHGELTMLLSELRLRIVINDNTSPEYRWVHLDTVEVT